MAVIDARGDGIESVNGERVCDMEDISNTKERAQIFGGEQKVSTTGPVVKLCSQLLKIFPFKKFTSSIVFHKLQFKNISCFCVCVCVVGCLMKLEK